jgi:hypothetical protein
MAPDGAPPSDDATIAGDTELWRRIPPKHWISDADSAGWRISSAAFEDSPDGSPMSVVIASECTGGLNTLLKNLIGFGVAVLTVQQLRARGLGVVRFPDADLPGHAHVIGRKSQSVRRKLAREDARIILEPTPDRTD